MNTIYQSKCEQALGRYDLNVEEETVQAAVEEILAKTKENDTDEVRRLLYSCVDLTSLRCTDSETTILALVERVNKLAEEQPALPHVAAICVYPVFAEIVSQTLQVDGVAIACVAGGFPSSQARAEVKVAEIALAVADGATEIDTLLPIGKYVDGDYDGAAEELVELKSTCGDAAMKVILETGCLETMTDIRRAAIIAMYAGADFVKTSTGKEATGATPQAVYVLCRAIRDYYELTGNVVGIKVAGGITTISEAIAYYTIVADVLGPQWLCPCRFRLGTSRLADRLLEDILYQEGSSE